MLGINSRPPMLGTPFGVPLLRRETLLGQALQNVVLPGGQVLDIGERAFAASGLNMGTVTPGPFGAARNYTGFPSENQYIPIRGAQAYPLIQAWIGRLNATGSGPVPFRMVRSLTGGSGDLRHIGGGSSTAISFQVRNNFSTTGGPFVNVPGGTALNVDLVVIAQSLSASDHRIYCNGAMGTDATNVGTPGSPFNQMWFCRTIGNNDHNTYLAAFGAGIALPDAYALELSRSPAKLFGELLQYPRRRVWSIAPSGAPSWSTSITEAAAAADSTAATYAAVAALTEAASASDGATATAVLLAAVSEAASAIDAIVASLAGAPAVSEAVTASDLLMAAAVLVASAAEAASAADAATTGTIYTVTRTEAAAAADALAAAASLVAAVSEAAASGDGASAAAQLVKLITEQAVPIDSVAGSYPVTRNVSITELVAELDLLTATLSSGAEFTAESRTRIGARLQAALRRSIGTSPMAAPVARVGPKEH